MKKIIVFIFLVIQFTLYGQLSWVQKDTLPSAGRYCHISFVIGDKAYAGLGSIDAEQRIYSQEFFRYDPANDTWERLADFPGGGRYSSSSFSLNGKGYVCLGRDTSQIWRNDVWEFDPFTEDWVKKSDFPGGSRYNSGTFVIGNNAYVVGGSINEGNNYLNDLWRYDPATDTWTQRADLPTDHLAGAVSFSINGKGYVVGGGYSTYDPVNDFYEYDPLTDTWNQLPDLPGLRTAAVGFVIGDKAYVGAGTDLNTTYKSFWSYSFETNSWSNVPVPPSDFSQRVAGTAFSIGNTGYVLAGRSEPYDPVFNNGKMLNDLWSYTTCILPIADFTFQVNNFVVNFADSSSGATLYYWDFGDGTYSNEKDPIHHFASGIFNVCHRVENECGQDSICKTIQILCPDPAAGFLYTFNYPEYQFNDTSAYGNLVSRLWDFGDSTYSNDPNPIHIYNDPGNYHVCLTVTDSCGTNTACKEIIFLLPLPLHVTITPAPTNDLLVQFNDLTTGTTFWKWDFGDGDSSELQNPSHLYRDYGNYLVCLTAGNATSLGTFCESVLLSVNPDLHPGNPVLVYPNPTEGKLFLRFYRNFSSIEVLVEDQSGKRVFNQYLLSPDLGSPLQIDLTGLARGLYFVRVKCDEYNKIWKIVIL